MAMTIGEMMEMQTTLQEKYRGIWEGDNPDTAKNHLLYAVEEIGEVSAILKKRGARAVVNDAGVRAHFCEEMSDVFMYLWDVMICCGVSAEEFEAAYRAKADYNLKRDFPGEHARYLEEKA